MESLLRINVYYVISQLFGLFALYALFLLFTKMLNND